MKEYNQKIEVIIDGKKDIFTFENMKTVAALKKDLEDSKIQLEKMKRAWKEIKEKTSKETIKQARYFFSWNIKSGKDRIKYGEEKIKRAKTITYSFDEIAYILQKGLEEKNQRKYYPVKYRL